MRRTGRRRREDDEVPERVTRRDELVSRCVVGKQVVFGRQQVHLFNLTVDSDPPFDSGSAGTQVAIDTP